MPGVRLRVAMERLADGKIRCAEEVWGSGRAGLSHALTP
jgi:hypothetical protein